MPLGGTEDTDDVPELGFGITATKLPEDFKILRGEQFELETIDNLVVVFVDKVGEPDLDRELVSPPDATLHRTHRLHKPSRLERPIDLTSVPSNDIDYYAYELARLQDAAREIIKAFDQPPEVLSALAAFDAAVPSLRLARNPLTHPSDDARLDDVGWFSALVRFLPYGKVEYLVDPRYQHHEAAEALAEALLKFLRAGSGTT